MAFGDFFARIGAEGREPEDDEGLFEQIKVAIHGGTSHLELHGEFVDRHFMPRLMSQEEQQPADQIRGFDQARLQNIFPKII